jgi:hypothetical protein
MEQEDSLPLSQQPATVPYPEPVNAKTHPKFNFLRINFNIILSSEPRSSEWSLPLRPPNQRYQEILISPCALHTPPISSSLIWSPWWYLMTNTNYGAPHSVGFSSLPSLHPSQDQLLSSAPVLRHPQPVFVFLSDRPRFTYIQNKR